jgi:Holliday junction resolvasome RuvABC DNA-binding subunit
MKSADEVKMRIAQLRAAADALEWALSAGGDRLNEPMRRSPATDLSPVALDCISALVNLGIGSKAKAEDATRKAMAEVPGTGFEMLFRAALKVLRP